MNDEARANALKRFDNCIDTVFRLAFWIRIEREMMNDAEQLCHLLDRLLTEAGAAFHIANDLAERAR